MAQSDMTAALSHDGVAQPLEHSDGASRPETTGSPDVIG
jgi:hypothetical protein